MENSAGKVEQLGIFVNENSEEILYESRDFELCLSSDLDSSYSDKKINIKITNK